jgi:mannose-6-phosphate isomerase-like protein (cupin superfamily)
MEGKVVRAHGEPFKASGTENGGRFDFFVLDIDYLTGPPLHVHDIQEDTFYVLSGVLTLQLGDEVVELQAGDYASAPAGVAHTFTNTRPEPARVINLMTPGIGFERFVRAAIAPDGADPEAMNRLAKECGLDMTGPPLADKLGLSA